MSHVRTQVRARARVVVQVAAAVSALLLFGGMGTNAVAAVTPGTLDVGAATPRSFVPDWTGEGDATAVPVTVATPSLVTVQVRSGAGHLVRAVARRAPVEAGTTTFYWDGRDAQGTTVAPGSYRIEVISRPASAATAGGVVQPDSGTAAVTATGARAAASRASAGVSRAAATVQVAAPAISVYDMSVSRGFLTARGATGRTNVGFRLSRRGNVSIAVADQRGAVVRNLQRGPHGAGRGGVSWNGRNDGGSRVADGRYTLLVSASGGGAPTNTLSVPLRVDTQAPAAPLASRRIAGRVAKGGITVTLPLRLSEAGRLTVRRGRTVAVRRVPVAPGARRMRLTGSQLGIRPTRRRATYRLHVTLSDPAGNVRTVRSTVVVRAARPSAPAPAPAPTPAPTPTPTPTVPTGAAGTMTWPVSGAFSSPYGPRGGRLHQGIDVSAPTGTPIVAAAAGLVSFSGAQGGYGNVVFIEHPGGVTTLYAHQSKLVVVTGQHVLRGELIGYVGSTGHSTGPHLHFETRVGGIARDPMGFLPRR